MQDFLSSPLSWTALITMIHQSAKQHPRWRNHWCKYSAPLLGLLLGLVAVHIAGGFWPTEALSHGKELWNWTLNGLLAGGGAVLSYDAQHSVSQAFGLPQLIPSGPDNHPNDQSASMAPPVPAMDPATAPLPLPGPGPGLTPPGGAPPPPPSGMSMARPSFGPPR